MDRMEGCGMKTEGQYWEQKNGTKHMQTDDLRGKGVGKILFYQGTSDWSNQHSLTLYDQPQIMCHTQEMQGFSISNS